MIESIPLWTFNTKKPLTKWYGHVHLLPDKVVGQWFCADRTTGKRDWQARLLRPNTICGFDSGIIVASEMRSDGPWTADFGCYGISMESGRLLWTSHGSGIWGRIVRLLDYVPGFTNELRDTPHYVKDGKVYCNSGRVLDVTSGKLVYKMDSEDVRSYEKPLSIGSQFAGSGVERHHPRVKVMDNLFLRHAQDAEGWQRGTLEIAAESESGKPLWTFSINHLGRHIGSYRLVPPFIYMLVSDEANSKPHPTKEHYALPNPTRWHFVTLSIKTGEVVQDFPLDGEKHSECRIDDVDGDGLLIGRANRELMYYRRTQHTSAETQPSDNADVE
ncbi:hypothetical protein Poly24_27570 [Rosistilla carotiformis]|uniref:Uncharacterized protein n=1 Tax=Rosistilla carotiformis TaxID=2528017 RepID=A0A518JU22_9BACT|nr:hypothetical protein [Rosistilla carotiformis]QDV69043.1 hypothetical protein Poly24_27570 [Rosistilla carotiformis]